MKYRRKPVVRDVVDALKDEQNYYYQDPVSHQMLTIKHDAFEAIYAPANGGRTPKVRKPRKAKEGVTHD